MERANQSGPVDLLVIGGGVNGAGIARDAAGRGLRVLLCEKDDLAQHTSSASTKLIHGGLRYLEHYEFKLVRDSLIEREVLLRAAPHIIWPMRFTLPHHKGLRPAWLLRLGLFLYDHLGGRKLLPPTKSVRFKGTAHAAVLSDEFSFGFEYSDCWVEDARLVVLSALDAKEHGADIRTRTKCVALERQGDLWRVLLEGPGGAKERITARTVVNAAGPWVDAVLAGAKPADADKKVRLIKGSHIVTRKLFDGEGAYILQHTDDRIIFAIPYERDYTLIGTTDVAYENDAGDVKISDEEVSYLCALVSEYFRTPVTRDDIAWSYSGVRPLFDDREDNASVVTRDYVFDVDAPAGQAPLLSIFGGKITTFRKLSEQAVDKLATLLLGASSGAWTRAAPLPGGDIPDADFEGFFADVQRRYSWAPEALLRRLARAYGTRITRIMGQKTRLEELGVCFGVTLFEAEARYLVDQEFARDADDILWRRSKLGLHMTSSERRAFREWFQKEFSGEALAPSDRRGEGATPGIEPLSMGIVQ
ncbi:MAG: glycerol-3-phosphate dehydrogenase [Pseudomonadota bacterium]